jgi:30S ribosomal protein S31
MGKGDKKTKKGKISLGSFGKLRPKRGKFRIKPKVVKHEVVNKND